MTEKWQELASVTDDPTRSTIGVYMKPSNADGTLTASNVDEMVEVGLTQERAQTLIGGLQEYLDHQGGNDA